uniref:Uncharacterized protein n=1 Tax=Cacopsylla melanoneura TaxID=428564 RepID=A0A8D9EAC9_9HEMI
MFGYFQLKCRGCHCSILFLRRPRKEVRQINSTKSSPLDEHHTTISITLGIRAVTLVVLLSKSCTYTVEIISMSNETKLCILLRYQSPRVCADHKTTISSPFKSILL